MAWGQQERSWGFPIETMQAAAQSRHWAYTDFDRVLRESERLPGQAHLSWKKELAEKEAKVRDWAFGLRAGEAIDLEPADARGKRNPPWSRDQLILALDLYLRFRQSPPAKDSLEVAALSSFLGQMGRAQGRTEEETFRNANGVYMKMMNFRRFDPEYTGGGRVGLVRGNKEEEAVWNEFHDKPGALAAAVAAIRSGVTVAATPGASQSNGDAAPQADAPYWVFVCNPKKWALDKFLASGQEHDAWGIRPVDQKRFAPGQLGIVRVGVDPRSAGHGSPSPEPGA
jgi:hypothetical protein